MEKNINIKKPELNNNKMKYRNIIMILALLLFCVNLANADHLFLKYGYEEGGGSIIFDQSGNGYDAITSGMSWSSDSYFGDYAGDFDGQNDYIYTYLPMGELDEFTFCSFVKPDGNNNEDVLIDIEHNGTNKFSVRNDRNTDMIYLDYVDESGVVSELILNDSLSLDTYTHLCVYVDPVDDTYKYWENNGLVSQGNISGGFNKFDTDDRMNIGTNIDRNLFMEGLLDSTLILDFEPNSTQLNDIYTNNALSITPDQDSEDEEQEIENTKRLDNLIIDYNPSENQSFTITDDIDIDLNYSANCEFYLDSNLYRSGEDKISYSFKHNLDLQNYTGNIYCYFDSGDTRYYEHIPNYEFEVVKGEKSKIKFNLIGEDFNVDDESLYISTPCIKSVSTIGDLGIDYVREANEGEEIYFQKVSDNQATFNLHGDTYEFCLINGDVQYSQNNFTTEFNINNINNVIELGKFDIDSNVTQSYDIQLTLMDIYKNIDPLAWGESWGTLISGLILLFLGVAISGIGVASQNGKITFAGVILILSAFGISVSGLFAMVV